MQIYSLVKTLQSPVCTPLNFVPASPRHPLSLHKSIIPLGFQSNNYLFLFFLNSYQHVVHMTDLHLHWSMIAGYLPEHTLPCVYTHSPATSFLLETVDSTDEKICVLKSPTKQPPFCNQIAVATGAFCVQGQRVQLIFSSRIFFLKCSN